MNKVITEKKVISDGFPERFNFAESSIKTLFIKDNDTLADKTAHSKILENNSSSNPVDLWNRDRNTASALAGLINTNSIKRVNKEEELVNLTSIKIVKVFFKAGIDMDPENDMAFKHYQVVVKNLQGKNMFMSLTYSKTPITGFDVNIAGVRTSKLAETYFISKNDFKGVNIPQYVVLIGFCQETLNPYLREIKEYNYHGFIDENKKKFTALSMLAKTNILPIKKARLVRKEDSNSFLEIYSEN